MKKLLNLALCLGLTLSTGCPPAPNPTPNPTPSYTYTDNGQVAISVNGAIGDRTIPVADLRRGSDDDFNKVVLPLVPKTTDPVTGKFSSYEPESIGLLLESLRNDGQTAVLKRPFVQFDAIMSLELGRERDIRFFGSNASDVQVTPGSSQPQIGRELIGLLALAAVMGVNINSNNSVTTYNIESWCHWPYPYSMHGYASYPFNTGCGYWWYGMWKDFEAEKSTSEIPPLPIDIQSPSGAITITSDMNEVVIRYGYLTPDGKGIQKTLTILLDNDGDGATNLEEEEAGTDLNDPNDFPTTVPNVIGKNQHDATIAIQAAHLQVGLVSTVDSSQPAGLVVKSDPAAGKKAPVNSYVDLFLSRGVSTTVTVPDVHGLITSDGEAILSHANLTVGEVTEENSATIPAGRITRTDPPAGTQVADQATIHIFVSSGPVETALSVQILTPVDGATLKFNQVSHLSCSVSGGTPPYTRIEWFADVDGQNFYSLAADYTPTAITASGTNKIYLFVTDSAGHSVTKMIHVVVTE